MQNSFSIGVDIGGSHICCAAVDMQQNKFLQETLSEIKIDNKASTEEILSNWSKALQQTIQKINIENLTGIGFAMPGPFDYVNGIALFDASVDKYMSLHNINIIQEIRKRLSLNNQVNLRFINDATAFAIAETWIGKGKLFERNLVITLGTGFGSAFIKNGVPVIDGNEVPSQGCVWHLPFLNGIADDSFSTRWFIKNYFEQTSKEVTGVKDVANDADKNPAAKKLFETYGENLATFLSPWLKKFNAQNIVIGGNVTKAYNLFGNTFETTLKKNEVTISVQISEMMETAAIIGSARLSDNNYWQTVKELVKKM